MSDELVICGNEWTRPINVDLMSERVIDHLELLKQSRFALNAMINDHKTMMQGFIDGDGEFETFGDYRKSKVRALSDIDKLVSK